MKMKRFKATDMRDAMLQIREEFGNDAVILETIRMEQGVEVSAAIDYDPADFATDLSEPAYPAGRSTDRSIDLLDDEDDQCFTLGAEQHTDSWHAAAALNDAGEEKTGDRGIRRMGEEVRSIRCLLEEQLSRLVWDEKTRRTPESASVMRNFSNLGLTPDLVTQLTVELGDLRQLDNMWTKPLAHLAQRLPVRDTDMVCEGGIFAIVGPTGVGKTTTIAKLAARYALRHNPADIALVSTDSFRIAAREQLETFGQILGTPVYQANDSNELGKLLKSLENRKLVLIDTAGMGQKDVRLAEQLGCLSGTESEIEVMLALPANAQAQSIREIVDAFQIARPSACILTKIDEASSLGGSFSALIRAGLPLAYITNGQRVPEDLHFARPRKSWLIKAAVELIRRSPERLGEGYMARHFGTQQIEEVNINACA